jgi:hypothetical protein
VVAGFRGFQKPLPVIFQHPSDLLGMLAFIVLIVVMIRVPLANAGSPDEPAPPTAIM